MKLNLREIIEIPGGSVPFAQELDTALLDFPSVRAYTAPITAEGKVVNTAGTATQMKSNCSRPPLMNLNTSPRMGIQVSSFTSCMILQMKAW